ncbi:MAG: SoxR reducing system RseC family protein [Firmicutes bacterium]|nr:SoxR reducing system RseC family protein [Bacillota bacterium]MBQ7242279.1 SoxR reducing system RseC family protein [Bacillota bacterium]
MGEVGQVIQLKKNLAVVKITRTEACAKCRACVAGMKREDMFIEAENECNARVSDWVEMELRDHGFLRAVLIMYGIPFVCFLVATLVSYYFLEPVSQGFNAALYSFLIGMGAVGLAYLWIRSKRELWKKKKYRPVATRITTKPIEECEIHQIH